MKRLVFVLACCLTVTAQQANKKEKFEFCGAASSHECFCIRQTQAVQDEYLEYCRSTSRNYKEWQECAAAMPGHCSIVGRQPPPVDDEQGEGQSVMPDHCTMMCKKHDCLCDDGPRCHIGHTAGDHNDAKKSR